jgi:hypothetical protein
MKKEISVYSDNGFAVIPVKPKSKLPAISWKEFETRRPTTDELEKWFGSNTNTNVGIVTGSISGLSMTNRRIIWRTNSLSAVRGPQRAHSWHTEDHYLCRLSVRGAKSIRFK